jgi:AcrR family transcriptional regulator
MKNNWDKLDKKGHQRAKKIGKVAARLFSRKGFLETTMDEIAAAAKISKGGMYYYFKSKTEVLYFVLSNYMDLVIGDLEQDLSHIKESEAKLKFIISRHIELYSNKLFEAKVLLHDAHCLPAKYFKVITEKERKYFQIVSGVLPDFFSNPIPKGEQIAITFTLFGMCNWIYSWYEPKGSVTPQKLSDLIHDIFLKGLCRLQ